MGMGNQDGGTRMNDYNSMRICYIGVLSLLASVAPYLDQDVIDERIEPALNDAKQFGINFTRNGNKHFTFVLPMKEPDPCTPPNG
jgi:hypothetical protein